MRPCLYCAVALAGGWVQAQFGITLQWLPPGAAEWQLMAAVLAEDFAWCTAWQAELKALFRAFALEHFHA